MSAQTDFAKAVLLIVVLALLMAFLAGFWVGKP